MRKYLNFVYSFLFLLIMTSSSLSNPIKLFTIHNTNRDKLEEKIKYIINTNKLQVNHKRWNEILLNIIHERGGEILNKDLLEANNYTIGSSGRIGFVVYLSRNNTFYGFDVVNCFDYNIFGKSCDIAIQSITVDDGRKVLSFKNKAEERKYIKDFENYILPIIKN